MGDYWRMCSLMAIVRVQNGKDLLPCVMHNYPQGCIFSHDSPHTEEVHLNEVLVQQGYASPMTMPFNAKYDKLFEWLYQGAVRNNRGLWR